MKNKTVGSFEAKTHLSSIFKEVQSGVEFIVTKRGQPIAKIIQYNNKKDKIKMNELIFQFDKVRNNVKGKIKIKEYIDEGRKY